MVMELGGSNEKLQDMLKDIRDDYAEVTRVMQFAQVMMNLATFKTAEEINKNTSTIIKRMNSHYLLFPGISFKNFSFLFVPFGT